MLCRAEAALEVLHHFDGPDGVRPEAALILSQEILFGTSSTGGAGAGTIFSLRSDGSEFRTLHQLDYELDGSAPLGELALSGTTLYGTTSGVGNYGSSGSGTVFSMQTDGEAFTILHRFAPIPALGGSGTNLDGARLRGGVTLHDGMLYGSASEGGAYGKGTWFRLGVDGIGFDLLHTFTPLASGVDTGGHSPWQRLLISEGRLIGSAR
jgi:uncharacterized repeat protein (TIGR03803 family)